MQHRSRQKSLSIIMLFTVALTTAVVIISSFDQHALVDRVSNQKNSTFNKLFNKRQAELVQEMKVAIDFIKERGALVINFKSRNRSALYENAKPVYDRLHQAYDYTHFYFTDNHRVNFLRVHQPGRFGDRIDRMTTKKAEELREDFYGVELGPLGTLTLRYVSPWVVEGRQIGYLEVGREINDIISEICKKLLLQDILLLKEEFLNRSFKDTPKNGEIMLGGHLYLQGKNRFFDKSFITKFLKGYFEENPAGMNNGEESKLDGKVFNYKIQDLKDVSGNNIGYVFLISDTTLLHEVIRKSQFKVVLVILILLLLVVYLVNSILKRLEQSVMESQESLAHASKLVTMGELSASIAHEINNPLTVIKMSAKSMRKKIGKAGV